MKRVTITELKNKLSQYLRLVKRGETIEVLERSVPIARIEGLGDRAAGRNSLLQRLARDGVVALAKSKPSRDVLRTPPAPCRVDPVEILIEERGDR